MGGAEEGIRTPTVLLPPAPQAGASAVPPLPRGVFAASRAANTCEQWRFSEQRRTLSIFHAGLTEQGRGAVGWTPGNRERTGRNVERRMAVSLTSSQPCPSGTLPLRRCLSEHRGVDVCCRSPFALRPYCPVSNPTIRSIGV